MEQYIDNNGNYWTGESVVIGDRRYVNPSHEILLQAGYHVVEPIEPDPLEMAINDKLNEIDEYDTSNHVNVFYLAGQPLWLDAPTRQTLRISIEAYQAEGEQQVTKWFNGQRYTFPTQVWLSMLNALEVYAAEALNVTETHRAAVNALTTVEDVEAYDITADYPEVLNFTPERLASLISG